MTTIRSILLVSAALLYAQGSMAAIKCWTNHEGHRECGNYVPPEFSQKETRTLNERGMTTEVRRRAMTREEQQQIADKQRVEALAKKERDEQAIKDQVLLSTFLKPEEIIAARDRKISVLDGYLELSKITLGKLNKKLDVEQKKAAKYKEREKPVPDAAVEQIKFLNQQILDKKAFMAQKEAEKKEISEKYDADHKHFIELKQQRRRR